MSNSISEHRCLTLCNIGKYDLRVYIWDNITHYTLASLFYFVDSTHEDTEVIIRNMTNIFENPDISKDFILLNLEVFEKIVIFNKIYLSLIKSYVLKDFIDNFADKIIYP